MTSFISPFALGATLYMPATRGDIADVALGLKIPELRSLVICLEDAVAENDIENALNNLRNLLQTIQNLGGRTEKMPLLFVRPRNTAMAATLNDWSLISHVNGFVLPKLTLQTLSAWEHAVNNPGLLLMPTLETADAYNPGAMVDLGQALKACLQQRIIALRIGGNDLMSCLSLRRSPTRTIYDTPVGYVISMLAGIMGSHGFFLTAPVFDQLSNHEVLREELDLDISHGLVGKTAIHPSQIRIIQDSFRVSLEDVDSASVIVNDIAPAVFKHNDAMCEPATHYTWAKKILERAKWHGIKPSDFVGSEVRRLDFAEASS